MWDKAEKKFLLSLNSHEKIQSYLDQLTYNPDYTAASPRYVMMTNSGHCFEGCLFAAAALELRGYKPLVVNLKAHHDDYHAVTVYQTKTGWGSFSKSNTTLLRGRSPVYRSVRELIMSYFDFYFNVKGELSLHAYTHPINLNQFNHLEWRTSPDDLIGIAMEIAEKPHLDLLALKDLKTLKPVSDLLNKACFLGSDPNGLYKP